MGLHNTIGVALQGAAAFLGDIFPAMGSMGSNTFYDKAGFGGKRRDYNEN